MTCRGGEGAIMGLELVQESGGAAINLVSSGSRRGGLRPCGQSGGVLHVN